LQKDNVDKSSLDTINNSDFKVINEKINNVQDTAFEIKLDSKKSEDNQIVNFTLNKKNVLVSEKTKIKSISISEFYKTKIGKKGNSYIVGINDIGYGDSILHNQLAMKYRIPESEKFVNIYNSDSIGKFKILKLHNNFTMYIEEDSRKQLYIMGDSPYFLNYNDCTISIGMTRKELKNCFKLDKEESYFEDIGFMRIPIDPGDQDLVFYFDTNNTIKEIRLLSRT
jgi:hypothetical protein